MIRSFLPRRTITILSLGLIAVAIALILSPDTVTAQDSLTPALSLREVIRQQSPNVQTWAFFRSLVNYGIVAALIAAAFASVLRINVDTYSIKRILPGLIIGFILANLSLQISTILIDVSDVLANTVNELFKQASGSSGSIASVISTDYMAAITAAALIGGTAGGILAPFTAGLSVGIGIIIGFLLGALIVFIPTIALLLLYILFLTRYYVIQFLVVLSPIAFFCINLPFGQDLFKRWWKYFTTWVFMKPMAYLILSLSGIVLVSKIGGQFISLIVGLIGIGFAVTIPFRAGGAITAAVNKYGRKGLGLSYTGARGGLAATGEGLNRLGGQGNSGLARFGRGLTGVAGLPEGVKDSYNSRKKETDRVRQARGAGILGNTEQEERLQAERVSEFGKTIDENATAPQLIERLQAAETLEERTAVLNHAYKSKQNESFFRELHGNAALRNRLGLGTAAQRDLQTASGAASAGSIMMGGNANGTGTAFSIRNNRQHHAQAYGNGQVHTGSALHDDGRVRTQEEIEGRQATPGGLGVPATPAITGAVIRTFQRGNSASRMSGARVNDWVGESTSTPGGPAVAGFSQGWIEAARVGTFNNAVDTVRAREQLDEPTSAALAVIERAHPGRLRSQLIATGNFGTGIAPGAAGATAEDERRHNLIRQIMGDRTYGTGATAGFA